jgi:hypothetical protein
MEERQGRKGSAWRQLHANPTVRWIRKVTGLGVSQDGRAANNLTIEINKEIKND